MAVTKSVILINKSSINGLVTPIKSPKSEVQPVFWTVSFLSTFLLSECLPWNSWRPPGGCVSRCAAWAAGTAARPRGILMGIRALSPSAGAAGQTRRAPPPGGWAAVNSATGAVLPLWISPWSRPSQLRPAPPAPPAGDLGSSRKCVGHPWDARGTPMGARGRGNHACPELPGSASVTSDPRSQLPCCREDGGAHTAQRLVCVTGAGVGRLTAHASRSVDSPGVGSHCESRLLESWLPGAGEEGSRSEVPSIAVVTEPRQTSAQLAGWSSWRWWCWRQPVFQWQHRRSGRQKLLPGALQI